MTHTIRTYRVKTGPSGVGYTTKSFDAESVEAAIAYARENTLARSGTDKAIREWLQVIENGGWVWVV